MSLLPVDPCDTCRRHHASDGFCEDDEEAPEPSRAPADHDRAVREARADLRVALYYEDGDAGERALAALTALGVDEAGDDLQPAEMAP